MPEEEKLAFVMTVANDLLQQLQLTRRTSAP
jgi:hypothetical protein